MVACHTSGVVAPNQELVELPPGAFSIVVAENQMEHLKKMGHPVPEVELRKEKQAGGRKELTWDRRENQDARLQEVNAQLDLGLEASLMLQMVAEDQIEAAGAHQMKENEVHQAMFQPRK